MMKRVLALLLALAAVFCLAACSKDEGDPNQIVIGDYTALHTHSEIVTDYDGDDSIAIYFDFTNNSKENASFLWSLFYTATQNGAELEQSTVFLSEDSFDTLFDTAMEEVAPGATAEVILTYKLADTASPVEIEFTDLFESKKDHLTIDMSTVTRAEPSLPAAEPEDAPEAEPEAEPETEADLGTASVYKAETMISAGTEIGADILATMGDFYVVFNGDGTVTMIMFGEPFALEDTGATFTISGVDFASYTLEGDTLTVDVQGSEFILHPTDEVPAIPEMPADTEVSADPTGYAFDSDIVEAYTGDWHGMAVFYDCTGDYSDQDEMECEIVARMVFDENGYCTPYIRLCLDNPEEMNFVIESTDLDTEYNCILLEGTLIEMPMDPMESFVEVLEDVMYIGAEYDDGSGDVFKVLGCLRRLDDDQWDYENDYPTLPQDAVDFYMGMTFEEIVALFGYDTSLIPALSGDIADIGTDAADEEPAADAADGIVELQQLIDWKNWLDDVNSYENEYYTPTYDECVAAMGAEPAPYKAEEWDDEYTAYKWTTPDGKDHIIMTMKPTDDGTGWRYHSISWSGGVNG